MTEQPADPAPLTLDPQTVIAELEAIPEARPYWQLAQERAARKAVQQRLLDQEQELQELRAEKARRDREPDTERPPDPGPSVITTQV